MNDHKASAWIPGWRLWRHGRRRLATAHVGVALVTLMVLFWCAWRASTRGLESAADVALVAGSLLLLPLVVLRVLAWSVDTEGAGSRFWQAFCQNRFALTGSVLVIGLFFVAALAPVLAPQDPTAFGDMAATRFHAPGEDFPLGSDQFGRDVLTRLLHGARISLGVAFLSVVLTMILGTSIGLAAGYGGGWLDSILMRLVDLLLAFPRIFLVLLVISLAEPSIWLVVGVLAVTGWMATARLVRSEVLSIRERDYVLAARALGIPTWRIVLRHVLPNSMAPIVVSATLMIGNVILAESVLSFLGLGVPVPTPSWGAMVDEGRAVFPNVWWLATFPGLAITVTVLAFNLLGDGLRDAWDPRAHG